VRGAALAAAASRNFAGVHYRSDDMQGLFLGEAVAISVLQDRKLLYNEDFSGEQIVELPGR
jgi:hypothetical protein